MQTVPSTTLPSPASTLTRPSASPGVRVTPTASDRPSSTPAASPSIHRDYGVSTPIPATGQLTVRQDIRTLDPDRLISQCPENSGAYAYAESTHYRIQICSAEFDPWLPKYYIGTAKDGSGAMHITSTNLDEARQMIFRHAGYTYIIRRDSARPAQTNAYLEIYAPDGKCFAEALLYLYENRKSPVH